MAQASGRRKPHIWTIEGNWSPKVRDVRSVDPVLGALRAAGVADHAHSHVNRRDDVIAAFRRWGQAQHERFNIGYVALHGSPGCVYAGRQRVDLLKLADELEPGLLKRKILHLGSCEVLSEDGAEGDAQDLRKALGVKVLCGFTKSVPWIPGLAFELLLFDALASYARPGNAREGLKRRYGDLVNELGFVMAT